MLYWMCKRTAVKPTSAQLAHAIMRNFGGMEDFNVYDEFAAQLTLLRNKQLITQAVSSIHQLYSVGYYLPLYRLIQKIRIAVPVVSSKQAYRQEI